MTRVLAAGYYHKRQQKSISVDVLKRISRTGPPVTMNTKRCFAAWTREHRVEDSNGRIRVDGLWFNESRSLGDILLQYENHKGAA